MLEACRQADGRESSGSEEGLRLAYFCGFGDAVAEDFDFHVTDRGVEGDGHGRRPLPLSLAAHNALNGNRRLSDVPVAYHL